MAGQWFGHSYSNEFHTTATIVINIESRNPGSVLHISVDPQSQRRMIADGTIEIDGKIIRGKTFRFQIYDHGLHAMVPLPIFINNHQIKEELPTEAEYTAEFDGAKIVGTYKNNLNQTGTFVAWRSYSEAKHGHPHVENEKIIPMKWEEFKGHIATFRSKDRILYRGQHSNIYPLKTSFHRKGRNNVPRYLIEDVFRLRHRINSISSHYYQQTPEDLQGLLCLAQHHGFPTPLLDWTESPYVAAFFAFDCLAERNNWFEKKDRGPVRIFTFDLKAWQSISRPLAQSLNDPFPDFQFFSPPAHNNPRYYPQQSMAAFSNLENIEDFIAAYEYENNAKYLTRIDILASERETVEDDLRFMGITPATLFPGFEGACKSLRAELFDNQ